MSVYRINVIKSAITIDYLLNILRNQSYAKIPGAVPSIVIISKFKAYGPLSLPSTIQIIVLARVPYITRQTPEAEATSVHNPTYIKNGFNISPVPIPRAPFKKPAENEANKHLKIVNAVYFKLPSIKS